jgi:hypothetical protein
MRRFRSAVLLATVLVGILAITVPQKRFATSEAPQAGNPSVKVWVNTSSGVYHCPGTRWYGNTKRGAYMTQKEAQEKGFRPAYNRVCASGEQSATPPASHQTQGDTQTRQSQQGDGNRDVKVWVNTSSGVYHCPGTRWYGNTKSGEYMTQKQAQEKGNRPAYGKPCQ